MTTLLSMYATKSVDWKRSTGTDQFGDVTFDTSTIKVRWQEGLRLTIDANGKEVASMVTVLTESPVEIGDTLTGPDGRDWPVKSVTVMESLSGRPLHREVMV